ncbi:MAG: hypothetical protein AAGI13_00915 [Pseudomonadota bacterium]
MFTRDSRYTDVPTVSAKDAEGREVTAVKLRPPGQTGGAPVVVQPSDRLDVIAEQCFADPTRFWHIADANSDLDARDLIEPGREIQVPER